MHMHWTARIAKPSPSVYATQVTLAVTDTSWQASFDLEVVVFDVPVISWRVVHCEAVLNVMRWADVTPPIADSTWHTSFEVVVFDGPVHSSLIHRHPMFDVISWVDMAPPMSDKTREAALEASVFAVPVAMRSIVGGSTARNVILSANVTATVGEAIVRMLSVLRRGPSDEDIIPFGVHRLPRWLFVLPPIKQQGPTAPKLRRAPRLQLRRCKFLVVDAMWLLYRSRRV
jgi:hypothetical protein